LVKRLVEMHGGSIAARSAGAGQGSEFLIRLPLAREFVVVPKETSTVPSQSATTQLRVLIVDDNRDNVASLRILLGMMGHDVHTAYDGLEGIETAGQVRPDVVLLDIGMPKLDGHETCRRIRSQHWGREMVLIAQTGWGQDEDRRRTSAVGFDYHLIKPVSHKALNEVLVEVMNGRASGGRRNRD
jgi:CheY-like chemotaxis protein